MQPRRITVVPSYITNYDRRLLQRRCNTPAAHSHGDNPLGPTGLSLSGTRAIPRTRHPGTQSFRCLYRPLCQVSNNDRR